MRRALCNYCRTFCRAAEPGECWAEEFDDDSDDFLAREAELVADIAEDERRRA